MPIRSPDRTALFQPRLSRSTHRSSMWKQESFPRIEAPAWQAVGATRGWIKQYREVTIARRSYWGMPLATRRGILPFARSRLRFDFGFDFQLDGCCDVLKEPDRNFKVADLLDVVVHV